MEELPMSEISDLLWLKSQDLAAKSNDLSKSWQMIKSAAIESLESRGIELSEAQGLLEKLAEKAYPNLDEDLARADELSDLSEVFEKAARYVGELEVKLSTKESEIKGLNKAANDAVKRPSVEALSGTGAFTNEDLDTLRQLDDNTLSKVAGLADKTPWNLGGPSDRMSDSGMDAMELFLTS